MRVAVYGSLKQGFGNHALLMDSKLVKQDSVSGFDMHSLGAFPGVVENPNSKVPVAVEVYEVTPSTLRMLDALEGHPHFYERKQVKLNSGEEAHLYIYKHDVAGRKLVESGNWSR